MQIPKLIYSVQPLITAPEIDTDVLWWLSIFFVALALLYFISVFVFRNKISSNASRIKERKNELSPMVSEFLFYEEDADKSEKSNYIGLKIEIRDLLREDFNRKVLTQILLDLRKDVSGDTQKRLFKLYQDLGLEKDAYKKLGSWRWEVVSKGILELTLMQVEQAYPFIVKFVNDRRGTIRKQAEISTVTLKPGGISYFLDTTKYKISEWQQLKLLDVLRNKENFEPPRFKAWLTSTNTHVVLFALRLIKYYNQNDANASLIELVKHKDRQVKQQAIDCIKEFHITEALPTFKGIFPKCTVDTKLGILGAIAELGDTSDIEFLETVAQREGNFSVKSKAVGAINTIAPESILPTENIEHITAYQSPVIDEKKVERTSIEGDAADLEQAREGPKSYMSGEDPVIADPEPTPTPDQNPNNDPLVIPTPMTHPKKSNNSLKNIEVEVEEVNPVSYEDTEAKESPNFDISEIHFLPLVVADDKEIIGNRNETDKTKALSKGNLIGDDHKTPDEVLWAIEVYHDEISSHPLDEELQALITEINELDFLPVVVDNEILSDTPSSDEAIPPDTQSSDNEILSETPSFDETVPLDTLSFDDAIVSDIPSEETNVAASESLENLEGYSLSDFEVSFEEKGPAEVFGEDEKMEEEGEKVEGEKVAAQDERAEGKDEKVEGEDEKVEKKDEKVERKVEKMEEKDEKGEDEKVEFNLEDAPIIDVESPNVVDVMSWLMADNELREIEVNYETVPYPSDAEISSELIPEPVYYDEHETYMMGLLDDLEELGDLREIPLLEELRAEESKSFIKERITAMIEKFARDRATKRIKDSKQTDEVSELPVFSVFADLFKSLDTECKLILLDEIVPVGDEKEIEFLDGLLEDPDQRIRDKAQTVLKLLIAKLSHENPEALCSKGVSDIVAVHGESDITLKHGISNTNSEEESFGHLLSKMEVSPAVAPEFFDIDFELCEVLDNTYDQKILEIPVIATDVSPDENGSTFFKSLRKFSKLFF